MIVRLHSLTLSSILFLILAALIAPIHATPLQTAASQCPADHICGSGIGNTEKETCEQAKQEVLKSIQSYASGYSTKKIEVVNLKTNISAESVVKIAFGEISNYQDIQCEVGRGESQNTEGRGESNTHLEYIANAKISKVKAAFSVKHKLFNDLKPKLLREMQNIKLQKDFAKKDSILQIAEGLYSQMTILEHIATTLDTLSKEQKTDIDTYNKDYKSMQQDFAKQRAAVSNGIAVIIEPQNKDIALQLQKKVANAGNPINQDTLTAKWVLKVNATPSKVLNDELFFYCYEKIQIELYDNFTGKPSVSDSFESQKADGISEGEACQKALEKSVSKIFETIQPHLPKETVQ